MIENIICAVIGGIITLFIERRREERQNKAEVAIAQKEIFENRPEFSIVEFKDYISRVGYGIKQKCDIEVFVARIDDVTLENGVCAIYRDEDLDENEWCCAIYTLKNMGKTDVSVLNIVSLFKKTTCIFPYESAKTYASCGVLTYFECYDRKIRVGECVTLKLCYHKDRIPIGTFSAAMVLSFQDSNGNFWEQQFFAPFNKVYDSKQINIKDYHRDLRSDDAIECFKKQYLW